MLEKIENIINTIIDNHEQDEDITSHNSIKEIDNIIFILGNICGLAIYEDEYEFVGEKYKHHLCVLLGEDDDHWFIKEGAIRFDAGWLEDYEDVMNRAKTYLDELKTKNKLI